MNKTFIYLFNSNEDAENFQYELDDNCGALVDSRVSHECEDYRVVAEGDEMILQDWRNDSRVVKSYAMEMSSI